MDQSLEQDVKKLVRIGLIAAIGVMIYWGGKYLVGWILPLLLGYFMAALVEPVAGFISRKSGLNKKTAGCMLLLGLYGLVTLGVILFGVVLTEYLYRQALQIPYYYDEVVLPSIKALELFLMRILMRILPSGVDAALSLEIVMDELQESVVELSGMAVGWLGNAAKRFPGQLVIFLFTIICSLLACSRYQEANQFLLRQVPKDYHPALTTIRKEVWVAVLAYFKAVLVVMLATFVLFTAGFWLLRVEAFLLLAVIVAVLELVPVLGMGVVLVPWAALSLLQGRGSFAAALMLLYAIALLLHAILEPRLIGQQLGINPLVGICAIYLGYRLWGGTGILLGPVLAQLFIGLHRIGVVGIWK